jgi:hypothetical protein
MEIDADAMKKLTNDVRKHVENWLIDLPAEEEEATKQQVLRLVDILIAQLQSLMDE